jgi:hypothetical protein
MANEKASHAKAPRRKVEVVNSSLLDHQSRTTNDFQIPVYLRLRAFA